MLNGDMRVVTSQSMRSGTCPICRNEEKFFEHRLVRLERLDAPVQDADEMDAIWNPTRETFLECGECRTQFRPELLE